MRLGDSKTVAFYNGIMKIFTVISLLTTILNPFITNANGSYSNIVQASYSYGIGYFDVGTSGGSSIDSQYYIDIDINIQGTYSGYIYINMTAPSSTMSTTYYPKYISVGGNYVGSGYSGAGINSFCFKITSSSHLYVRLYYGLGTLHTYFGLQDNANQNLNWTNSGNQYVAVTSLSVSSFTKDSDFVTYIDDLESSINTLKTYTDSVENYLIQIWNTSSNIYSTLTYMSTNITSINEIISSINDKLNNIDSINWKDISTSYRGYTTDFETYDYTVGEKAPGYYVFDSFYSNPANPGLYYLEIPIGNAWINFDNLKFYTMYNNTIEGHDIVFDKYLFFRNRSSIVLYFIVNENYHPWPNGDNPLVIQVKQRVYFYSTTNYKTKYILQDDINYWTVYNTINQLSQLNKMNNSLDQILSILGSSGISQSDQQNKTTVDNFFNQVLENLNLPSFPNKDSEPMFPILKEFIGIYGQIVGNQHLSMYKWLLSLSSVFLILKVILL